MEQEPSTSTKHDRMDDSDIKHLQRRKENSSIFENCMASLTYQDKKSGILIDSKKRLIFIYNNSNIITLLLLLSLSLSLSLSLLLFLLLFI